MNNNQKVLERIIAGSIAMGWASDAETESLRAAIAAQEPKQAMTDAEIEELAIQRGGRWDGNTWVFEDADLHPFARAILAASSPNKELVEALQRVEQELIKLEHAVGGGDGEIYVEGAILTCQAALRAAGVEVA